MAAKRISQADQFPGVELELRGGKSSGQGHVHAAVYVEYGLSGVWDLVFLKLPVVIVSSFFFFLLTCFSF